MEKEAPNSKFVRHSTEMIRQSKIKGPLPLILTILTACAQVYSLVYNTETKNTGTLTYFVSTINIESTMFTSPPLQLS